MPVTLSSLPRTDLRQLILALTVLSVLMTLTFSLYSGYQSQRELLISRTLEENRIYASKLAESADVLLRAAQQQVAYASREAARHWDDPAELAEIALRLQGSTQTFNASVIVDTASLARAAAPAALALTGKALHSAGNAAILAARVPQVSQPFLSTLGRLIITVTHPIERDGRYLGYVSGTLYLQEKSILQSLLGRHPYQDGSYLYVVDEQGRLLYHPDSARLGTEVRGNPAIDAVRAGHEGSLRLTNSQGVDMLAGYAPVPTVSWGIIAQQPTKIVLDELGRLTAGTFLNTLPWLALSLLLIGYLSRTISRPLSQLARRAHRMEEAGARQQLEAVHSWYFEAAQLKVSLLAGLDAVNLKISRLSQESQTDQLTGLPNRREMERHLALWETQARPFAVVMFDIDHFKRVNDTYGHDVGDSVLREIAGLVRQCSRGGDLPCRTGGEEFVLLLPDTPLAAAFDVAERLRLAIAGHDFQLVGAITVSCGVSHLPDTAGTLKAVLKAADVALYEAKRGGRNRSVVAPPAG